ncbi:hypothetical protein NP233_g7798 [Leucocoprinus birnbaumii]|uniref:Cation efflux protein transmembrane domain-containing protein n=1 Tax=Leucocoprinus birnbaumii TaxID=56174 RepID=A0AAD5VU06_9AGAR|nr:hypothetical protein NP233_g7798 [Leucocoprinus birnbaumii]
MQNTTRIGVVLLITFAFFIAETAGFKTQSLALIADALHYFTYVVAYSIAFIAAYVSYPLFTSTNRVPNRSRDRKYQDRGEHSSRFTFVFNRAELVGTFFNGAFLLALALSVFLQSLERFANVEVIEEPFWVFIVGCVGLGLNTICALVIYGKIPQHHDDDDEDTPQGSTSIPGPEKRTAGDLIPTNIHAKHNHTINPPVIESRRNIALLGVMIHILGDALNNIGVIIAAFIMWKKEEPHSQSRFYADPVASALISLVIFAEAIHLTLKSGRILLEASPLHLDLEKIKEDLLTVSTSF